MLYWDMDIFSEEKRSQIMSNIKSSNNKSTELRFYDIIDGKIEYPLEKNDELIGKPDFVINSLKIAIFIDGAFWHGHKGQKLPGTNKEFWLKKIKSNKKRDRIVTRELRKSGWIVLRIWDFELKKKNEKEVIRRVRRLVTISKRRLYGKV